MSHTELSEREQAAIRLYLYENEEISPVKLYRTAYAGSLREVDSLKDLPASASRWLRSKKVSKYLDEQRAILNDRKAKERMKIESEAVARIQASATAGKHMIPGFVDYSQPSAQLNKLNELINTASDPGEVLDALKVLLSKQTELAPQKTEKASRFYRPLVCSDCPLYAMAGDVLRLRAAQDYNSHAPGIQAEIDARLREGGRRIIEKYVQLLITKQTPKQ